MNNKKNALVLVYILFLVTLFVVFATVLLNNNAYLFNISELFQNDSKLLLNIDKDSKISISLNKKVNTNWNWFIDNISCPWLWGVSMDWNVNSDLISTSLINSWSIYCEWNYFWDSVKIYFNTWFTDFVEAEYKWDFVTLSGWLWLSNFSDTDNTAIDFSSYNYFIPDWYDDDFNSDNYLVTSTWDTSTGTYYPSFWQDDDVLYRKTLYWFVFPDSWYKKVFWNTKKTLKTIDENTNNNDNLNEKIWNIESWYLYLNVDNSFDIKLVKFDKNIYEDTNELYTMESFTWSWLPLIWYLQNNSWILSLSLWITWNEYSFDFKNNDYAIFIKPTWTWTLVYNISWFSNTGTWIYINPIDDSNNNFIRYLWNEILIDNNWLYMSKETELFFNK